MTKKYYLPRLTSLTLLATLTSTFLSSGADAIIPFAALKDVTPCFKSGKEFNSTTIGRAALEARLMDIYRLQGNYTAALDANGHPQHDKDISNGDHIWDMERIFFPSPAGHLTAESTRITNLGNNIDHVKTVALLYNYVNALREGQIVDEEALKDAFMASLKRRPALDTAVEETKRVSLKAAFLDLKSQKVGELNKDIQTILINEPDNALKTAINKANTVRGRITPESLQGVKQKLSEALDAYLDEKIRKKTEKYHKDEMKFKKDFSNETLNPLLQSIAGSLKGEKDSLYPEHTVEQIISAFFCYKFNTRQDVVDLLHELDDSIVDKSKIPNPADELKEEDLPVIASTLTYGMDDVFALELADMWTLLVPYRDGSAPLSNGNTYQYDRINDKYLMTKNLIADCQEIAARHMLNMLLYTPLTKDWDLSHLQHHLATHSPDNKYFPNFEEFYKTQRPNRANSGDIEMRSLWNKVVGDLNAYGEGVNIIYSQGTNELEPGFINLIRVFEKIFALPLQPFPAPTSDKPAENFEAKLTWLHDSFQTLFMLVNPSKTYDMNFSQLTEENNELSGYLPITVNDQKTREELFSFTFYSVYKQHGEILNLRILKDMGTKDYMEDLKSHATFIPENTAAEAVWMVSLSPELRAQKLRHPLYSLFDQGLESNDSKISFLQKLNDNLDDLKNNLLQTPEKLVAFKAMLVNILNDISWDDWTIVERLSPVIFSLLEKQDFNDTLAKTVKSLYVPEIIDNVSGDIIQQLENLRNLYLPQVGYTNFSFLKAVHPNLKMIDARESALETLEGLEKAPNVEHLVLSSTEKFREIGLSQPHTGLKILDLSSSKIENVSDLHVFENLEDLNLRETSELQTLAFTQLQPQLKKIDLDNSSILHIENLGYCPNLENFNLGSPSRDKPLQSLSFNGPLSKLTKLDIRDAHALSVLTGLDCPNLEVLGLYCQNLKQFVISNSMPCLKILDVNGPGLEELIGLDNCLNLENLSILNARLKTLPVNEVHENLKAISLRNMNVGLSTFAELLKKSPNVETLDMNGVGARPPRGRSRYTTGSGLVPEKLSFNSPRNALKTLSIVYCGLGEFEGLAYCPNIEKITLQGAGIQHFALTTPHEQLREITLCYSTTTLKSFEGMEHCPNLKQLNLSNTYYPDSITFEKDNKDLVIAGVLKRQISGIEHLDERNIK